MIVLKNISKTEGNRRILSDVSAEFEPGQIICLLGKSGSGKSSLLGMLMAAEKPTEGSVEIDGVDLKKIPAPILQIMRRRMGVVFSDLKLLTDQTVAANVAYPLEICGVPDAAIRERVPKILEQTGLSMQAQTPIQELPRSAQVTVALARALAGHPLILIVDDPFRMLDRADIEPFIALLKSVKTPEMTIFCSTSDVEIAQTIGGRIFILEEGSLMSAEQAKPPVEAAEGRQSRKDHAQAPTPEAPIKEEIPLGVLSQTKPQKQAKQEGPRRIKVTGIGS